MAGETLRTNGSFTSIIASAAVADDALSAESTAIATALSTGDESDYPLLDFQLHHSATNAATDAYINLYRRSKADGTNQAPAPNTTDYLHDYVGSFRLDGGATGYYYLFGVANDDPSATYYVENKDGTSSLTMQLYVRARTYKAAT